MITSGRSTYMRMERTVISALKTVLISDDFPERDCNEVETKISINTSSECIVRTFPTTRIRNLREIHESWSTM